MTPVELLGRVVAFRSSLVFGAMTLAMAIASILAESIDAGLVIAAFGALTMIAGLSARCCQPCATRQRPTSGGVAEPALQ